MDLARRTRPLHKRDPRVTRADSAALLLTDTHPEKLTDKSLRLLVPLRDADKRFGGIETFFAALADFAKSRNPVFSCSI